MIEHRRSFGDLLSGAGRVEALSLRALARAASDDDRGATEDIGHVRADAWARPEVLARAALAEALLIDRRAKDGSALAAHLDEHWRMLERLESREAALLHALRRKLRARVKSPYREAPPAREPRDGPASSLVEWMQVVAPSAAPFIAGASEEKASIDPMLDPRYAPTGTLPTGPRPAPIALAKRAGAFLFPPFLVFLGTLSAVLLLPSALAVKLLPLVWLLGMGALGIQRLLRVRLGMRDLNRAERAVLAGEPGAVERLRRLVDHPDRFIAAWVALRLAEHHEREGLVPEALELCERGLQLALGRGARTQSIDIQIPGLIAERAFLQSVLGATDDAARDLRSIPAGYAFRPRAVFRVELLRRVKEDGFAAASELVGTGELDYQLTERDELLVRLVRAVGNPAATTPEDRSQLRAEVGPESRERRWLEAIAPELLNAFETGCDDGREAIASDVAAERARI